MKAQQNSILGQIWAPFAHFRATKNLSGKFTSVTFLFLNSYRCADRVQTGGGRVEKHG